MKVLLIRGPNFIDLAGALVDSNGYQQEQLYNSQGTNSIPHQRTAVYDDYAYQYAPADVYNVNYQEQQLLLGKDIFDKNNCILPRTTINTTLFNMPQNIGISDY